MHPIGEEAPEIPEGKKILMVRVVSAGFVAGNLAKITLNDE